MIEQFKNLQSENFNQAIIGRLVKEGLFKLSIDEQDHGDVGEDRSDAGLLFTTFHEKPWHKDVEFFNSSAELIFDSVLRNSQQTFTNIKIVRIMWNYYNRASSGVYHQDMYVDNYYSILYNLSTTDGGTIVDNTFYEGEQGSAVLFPSAVIHKGVGPTKFKHRFALNIVFEAVNLEEQ